MAQETPTPDVTPQVEKENKKVEKLRISVTQLQQEVKKLQMALDEVDRTSQDSMKHLFQTVEKIADKLQAQPKTSEQPKTPAQQLLRYTELAFTGLCSTEAYRSKSPKEMADLAVELAEQMMQRVTEI